MNNVSILRRRLMVVIAFLAAMMVCFATANIAYADENAGDFGNSLHWELSDGTLTISGSGAMPDYSIGVWVQNGAPWYEARYDVKRVVVKDGVTSIGNQAFVCCREMTSITLPKSITHIGSSAFEDCNALSKLELNEGVVSLGTDIIKSNDSDRGGVEHIVIPSTVKVMPNGCIGRNYNLRTVEFSGDAPAIGEGGIFGDYFLVNEITIICKEDAKGFDTTYWSTFKEVVKSGHKSDGASEEGSTEQKPEDEGIGAKPSNPSDSKPSVTKPSTTKPSTSAIASTSKPQIKAPAPVVLKSLKRVKKAKRGVTGVARIKWKKASGANGYYIYKKVGKKYKKIATIKNPKKTSFKLKKLKHGKTYRFTVKAFKYANSSKKKTITGVYDKVGLRIKM